MTRTIGIKGETMRASIDPRPRVPALPLAPSTGAHLDPLLRARLERVRDDRFLLIADGEARRLKYAAVLPGTEKKNTKRRKDRTSSELTKTPEGRDALAWVSSVLSGAPIRMTARMLARSGPEFRPAIGDGFKLGTDAVEAHNVKSPTGQAYAYAYGLLLGVGMHLLGESTAEAPNVLSMTRSGTLPSGSKGTARIAGFGDRAQLALAFMSKAAVMFELMLRAETAWRAEETARVRAREAARWTQAAPVRPVAPALVEPVEVTDTTGTVAPEADEEHGPLERQDQELGERDAGDEEPIGPVMPAREWCPIRSRMVPAAMAGKPRPSAGDGPDWGDRMKAEDLELARFDEEVRLALRAPNTKRTR